MFCGNFFVFVRTEVLEHELLLPTNNGGGALAFYGKLNGRFLEWLSMLDALFLTVC